jgi:hypothetical protein
MLRHIGLAAVVVALVTLTADTVHGRGGMRGHSTFRYNFGSGGYSAGDSYSGGSSTVSSHYRGSSGTSSSSRKSSKSAGNSLSSEETSSTSTGAIANITTRHGGILGGSNTATTQQTAATTTPVSSTPPSSSTQTQPLVANTPLGLTPTLGIPLSQDPNTSADRTYRGLLHNAKQLIKAGVYPPAINDLQRIINGAPGTRIAAEAQRLLARIPTN